MSLAIVVVKRNSRSAVGSEARGSEKNGALQSNQ